MDDSAPAPIAVATAWFQTDDVQLPRQPPGYCQKDPDDPDCAPCDTLKAQND